jgi:SH3-like domain-containing protein
MRAAPAAALVVLALAVPAGAAEFRSVGSEPGVLYDAPSTKARKLYVVSRDYPLEVVVRVQGWTKVRDAEGGINWIEDRLLIDRRTVMVKAARAEVRQAAEDGAPAAFVAEQGVVLELVEPAASGWARVRHRDGASGFVRITQVWGL